jgi:hypothetical protein
MRRIWYSLQNGSCEQGYELSDTITYVYL